MSAEWMIYNEPCPHCGGLEFLETSKQDNVVTISERESSDDDVLFVDYVMGNVVVDDVDVKEVWCRGCDTQLL